jgi:3-oxoacyl-[acyl-carrier-protein] synthase II
MQESFFPPTINLENPDSDCDLDCVPGVGIHGEIRAAMKESMGFGGQNAVLVFRKL